MDIDLAGTELVVLSACDTGAGKVTEGQGVFGLCRAFVHAGAKNVLMSLWPVDDATTVTLMVTFYRNLQHSSPAKALRQAQLALLNESTASSKSERGVALATMTSKQSRHPYLWAPFFLTVNP